MELSLEQQTVFNKYIEGQNIFITGPGGSGKTAIIKCIYEHAMKHNICLHVTALTGCAAIILNCKATTLHSWANIGLGNKSIEETLYRLRRNSKAINMWLRTKILIVDEVSMLSLKLFELLNALGKAIRKNSRPFGGIQVIFSGDFFQLPPVGSRDEPETRQFCFESTEWNNVFQSENQVILRTIYRQTDMTYTNILNELREGNIQRSSIEILNEYTNREKLEDLSVVKLFPLRRTVDQINTLEMGKLKTLPTIFEMEYKDTVEMTDSKKLNQAKFSEYEITNELEYIAKNILCDKTITLKVGAQVMSIINIKDIVTNDLLVCNGSQGKIIKFDEDFCGWPIVKFNNGQQIRMGKHFWGSEKIPGIGVYQIPLILSWALTIHKCQGLTIDNAEIDIGSNVFECGQSYVALSRLRSLDGLYLKAFDAKKIKIYQKVKTYYDELNNKEEQIEV